ncbi:S1 family peptidase [Citrobacter freundii]|uniref:S1 family peptidase n=1 Tax=Citrobacter freundii TaxID=546 RepID=UPI001BD0E5B3|nr:serine protease [Citrobacter freundii]
MSVSQDIHKSTVRLVSSLQNGTSVGTAFWFYFRPENDPNGQVVPVLVTNKHVVRGASEVRMRINVTSQTDPNIHFHDLILTRGERDFIMHPDADIDICILPMGPHLNVMEINGLKPNVFSITEQDMPGNKYITPIEDVYMTGYPNGLWDSVNNKPITRKGTTASSPIENWNGKPEFMIDMACFGGSSGSPVYIMNQGVYPTANGTSIGNRFIFLGLLWGGPMVNVDGSIEVVDVPTVATPIVRSSIGLNLGFVIKAEKLSDFRPLLGL